MATTARAPHGRRVGVLVLVAALTLALAGGAAARAGPGGDPYRSQQWSLDRIGVEEAWATTRGAGAVVAVVDTGVALDHPDLFDRITKRPDGSVIGVNLVDDDLDPSDHHGHGTLVAGVVAATAEDGHGIVGVAPDVSILPVRVLDADGAGSSAAVGRGIRWAVDQGADVVNVSLEAAPGDGTIGPPGIPDDAARYADARGVLVVAAAGNQPGAAAGYPDDSPVILVGAVDRDDQAPPSSRLGRPDGFVAPGVEIVSTWCRRTDSGCDVTAAPYGIAEGTSFAAPHVSGVAALLVAAGFDATEVRARLVAGAVDLGEPGPDPAYGHGRVDAAASLGGAPAAPPGAAPPDDPSPPDPGAATASEGTDEAPPPPVADVATGARAPSVDEGPVVVEELVEQLPGPTEPVGEGSEVVTLEAMSSSTPRGDRTDRWLRLLAGALVAVTMASWSSVARTET